jgi:secreted PhoX family phosphatase
MDRPEDVETNPVNGRTYIVCTNNSSRQPAQVDEANPRANNKHGHIIELNPTRGDHTRRTFQWKIVLIAGDPADPTTYFSGYDRSEVSPISCPDNIAFDRAGNLWISTDGNALGACDGLYAMPLSGPHQGNLQQFLSVPAYGECCGPVIKEDGRQRMVFAAVQHPGEVTGASPDAPASRFPYLGDGQPRPGVIQVFRS